jgi:hypothetical protein
MAPQNDATAGDTEQNDENTDEIDGSTIIVDPDDILEAMRRNARDEFEQRSHAIRLHPPFGDRVRGSIHMSQDGNYYPPEMDPKPIHVSPNTFATGRADNPLPYEACFPIRNDSRARFREEFGADPEDEPDEWEEWWGAELEVWEGGVRRRLKDEIEVLVGPESQGVAVSVEYDDRDE